VSRSGSGSTPAIRPHTPSGQRSRRNPSGRRDGCLRAVALCPATLDVPTLHHRCVDVTHATDRPPVLFRRRRKPPPSTTAGGFGTAVELPRRLLGGGGFLGGRLGGGLVLDRDQRDLAAVVDVGDLHTQLVADVHHVLDLGHALAVV